MAFEDDDDPVTEADTPAIDPDWDGNPFAGAFEGAGTPAAPPPQPAYPQPQHAYPQPEPAPQPSQVSGLRLPPATGNISHAPPVLTQSGPHAHVQRQSAPSLPMPPQPIAPQIPLPDPRTSGPLPQLPMPPPGYGLQSSAAGHSGVSSAPTSSINYTIDVILTALNPAKKRRRIILAVIAVLLIGAGITVAFILAPGVGKTLDDGTSQQAVTLDAPTWQELKLSPVAIRTTPPDARVVVNGAVPGTGVTTPATVDIVAAHPNTLAVYADGHFPQLVQLPGAFDPSAGIDVQLEPVEASPVGYIKVLVQDEDLGAEVFIDGKNYGKAPVLAEDLPLGVIHHVQVVREGKAPWVQIFRTTDRRTELTAPPLATGVFTDRSTEVELTYAPPQAKLTITGTDNPDGRMVLDKGKLLTVDLALGGHQPWQYNIHTTHAGSFRVAADLVRQQNGKARVRWRTDRADLRTCLVRPGQGFCWREDPALWLNVDEGTWTVRVYEDKGDGAKVYLEDEQTITFAANQRYKVELAVSEGKLSVDGSRPRDWDPSDPTRGDD